MAYYKELLNGTGAASCLELPSSVRREVEVEEIRQEVETAMHKMKKGKATDEVRLDMMEMAGEVGVKWTGRLLKVCMQDMTQEGHHATQTSTETAGEGFRCKDQKKSRR